MDRRKARRRAEARARRLGLSTAKFVPGGKQIRLGNEATELLVLQMERFKQKFGRDPGPDDPIFFDPDSAEPRPIDDFVVREEFLKALDQAAVEGSVRVELAYAVRKTGRIVTENNWHLLTDEELDEWDAAVEEGRRLSGLDS